MVGIYATIRFNRGGLRQAAQEVRTSLCKEQTFSWFQSVGWGCEEQSLRSARQGAGGQWSPSKNDILLDKIVMVFLIMPSSLPRWSPTKNNSLLDAIVMVQSQLEGGVLAPVETGGLFSTRRGSRTKEERESGTKPRPLRG